VQNQLKLTNSVVEASSLIRLVVNKRIFPPQKGRGRRGYRNVPRIKTSLFVIDFIENTCIYKQIYEFWLISHLLY